MAEGCDGPTDHVEIGQVLAEDAQQLHALEAAAGRVLTGGAVACAGSSKKGEGTSWGSS